MINYVLHNRNQIVTMTKRNGAGVEIWGPTSG